MVSLPPSLSDSLSPSFRLPIPWLLFAFVEVIKNVINGRDPYDVNPIEVKSGTPHHLTCLVTVTSLF